MPSRLFSIRALSSLLALGLLLSVSPADAAKKPKGKPDAAAAAAAAEKDKPFKAWKEVTKDAETVPGFFTLYKKRENLYLEIQPAQLDKPFLGIFSFARGIGSHFILGGLPLNDRVIQFERAGDHVFAIEKNTLFTAPAGSPVDKARDLSLGNSVLASFKIESIHDSSKALLIDFAPFVVSDVSDLAEGIKGALGNKPVRFDKERSALGSVKNFPENTEVEALLTYSPNDRNNLGLESVPDERYIPITVHYSFSKLPDNPMTPRMADDRVGYFMSVMKDFGNDTAENFFVRYLKRWRLEKKDPAAAVSDPVKPIVFYIDHTVPVEYREFIRKGVEGWQPAFEAAGFSNAIIAKDAPDDPNWDAEDVRYSTIRWITSNAPSFGAIGPSRMDPRTGEILDADVLIEGNFMQGFRNTYRRWAGPEAMAQSAFPQLTEMPSFIPPDARCDAQMGLLDGGALMRTALLVEGAMPPGSAVPIEFMGDALTWVTLHEVGHTLGLRHNFRSSTATPPDKLHDRTWTREHGLTGSVMDYLSPNISADRSKQGEYFGTVPGTYDTWAIRFAYAPSGQTDIAKDAAFAKKIADESTKPGHEYSTDDDTYPANALDPRTNIYDLSGDPLAWARERSAYIASLWRNGKFEDRILGEDGEYPVLRRAMDVLLQQYTIAMGMAVKYVGGQYHSRSHKGQPGALAPLEPVPAARQREALDFLSQRAFAANAFDVPPAVLNKLAADRWSHWGTQSTFSPTSRVDYNLNDKVFAIQNTLVTNLTAAPLLARLREGENRVAAPFTLAEHFDRMTTMLWGDVGPTAAALKSLDGPGTRRQIQRAYVDRLANMVVDEIAGLPDDARALARLQLVRIDNRASRTLGGEVAMGDATRAHLLETRARVKRALEASREATAARPAGPGGPFGAQ
jgi:hypothetical protein